MNFAGVFNLHTKIKVKLLNQDGIYLILSKLTGAEICCITTPARTVNF